MSRTSEVHHCYPKIIYEKDKYGKNTAVGRHCEDCGRTFTMNGSESESHNITYRGGIKDNKSHFRRMMAKSNSEGEDG